jgi:hypothetical protein
MNGHERIDWDRLQKNIPRGEAYVARVAFPETSSSVLAAIDSSGNRHFLVPITPEDDLPADNQSRGMAVTVKNLHVKGNPDKSSPDRYIDISLKEESEKEIFDIIGYQIAMLVKDEKVPTSRSVRFILERWRHFWGNISANLLTKEEIVGLFSELWFINHWLLSLSTKNAIMGWRGPYGGRHDFEWEKVSVEVKGTTITEGRKHWVNGLDQLSPPENGKLYLFSLKLREEEGTENTLTDVIKSCLESVAGEVELEDFIEQTLAIAGYSPAHDDNYSRIRFRVIDEALYEVTDRFPRITQNSFREGKPDGVERLEYQINLEGYSDLIVSKVPFKGLSDLGIQ